MRQSKVTQEAVNAACEQLHAESKSVTVSAVTAITGGSFTTVGAMVKAWKAEQVPARAPELPESITRAMQSATNQLWSTATALANEQVERIHSETTAVIANAKAELEDYASEISRLEAEASKHDDEMAEQKAEFEKVKAKNDEQHKQLIEAAKDSAIANAERDNALKEIAKLEARSTQQLTEQSALLNRLQTGYEELQKQLIEITKGKGLKPVSRTKTKPKG